MGYEPSWLETQLKPFTDRLYSYEEFTESHYLMPKTFLGGFMSLKVGAHFSAWTDVFKFYFLIMLAKHYRLYHLLVWYTDIDYSSIGNSFNQLDWCSAAAYLCRLTDFFYMYIDLGNVDMVDSYY